MRKLILTAVTRSGEVVARSEYVGNWYEVDAVTNVFRRAVLDWPSEAVEILTEEHLAIEDQIKATVHVPGRPAKSVQTN